VTRLLSDRPTRLAVALVALYLLGVLPSLGQSLLETHAHRQTQTAYTAVLYAERGIDLLRPPLPILGPPGSIPQEFPIFQAIGATLIGSGLPADLAMRIVGLAAFLACAALLWLLARRLMGSLGALVTLAAFMFNAHAWLYGRTSLIEYLATAGCIGFLYFAIRWMDEGHASDWVAAVVAGAIGVLVKITTGGFYLLPALLWRSPGGRWGFQRPSVVALVVIPMAAGFAWSGWAQAVREETPASVFLSMENQLAWFFGSVGMRVDPGSWRVPLVALLSLSGFGIALWAPMAVARARTSSQPAFLVGLLGLVVAMPLLLFNLYAIHDYYWAAVAPLIALGIGLGFEWLSANWDRRWVRRVGVGLAGAWVATIVGTFGSWSIIYGRPAEEDRAMRIAEFVRDHSAPDDWVVLRGWGWNSTFLYYGRRHGLAVPEVHPGLEAGEFGTPELSDVHLERILADPVFGPFIFCDREANCVVESQS
jgi:dolichyl-phosphate-mannose-protein mannosyltransferase